MAKKFEFEKVTAEQKELYPDCDFFWAMELLFDNLKLEGWELVYKPNGYPIKTPGADSLYLFRKQKKC